MVARRFNEADVDFEAIDGDLAKLAPPKLSLKDVLDRLRERMLEQRAKGVTVAQMHEVLKARGIEIGERSLKGFLDKGELPGRKAAKVAAAGVGDRVWRGSVLGELSAIEGVGRSLDEWRAEARSARLEARQAGRR